MAHCGEGRASVIAACGVGENDKAHGGVHVTVAQAKVHCMMTTAAELRFAAKRFNGRIHDGPVDEYRPVAFTAHPIPTGSASRCS